MHIIFDRRAQVAAISADSDQVAVRVDDTLSDLARVDWLTSSLEVRDKHAGSMTKKTSEIGWDTVRQRHGSILPEHPVSDQLGSNCPTIPRCILIRRAQICTRKLSSEARAAHSHRHQRKQDPPTVFSSTFRLSPHRCLRRSRRIRARGAYLAARR